ncbi:MAG: hypothetical protein EPO21_06220 [Chloroflexota bacterium]|nr:MAG: hypothetical protein EPO21_06220 [Chloroflexota bacterium]
MPGIGVPELMIVLAMLAIAGIVVVPYWRIFSRAGFPGWLGLGQLVPLLNIILLFYLAFAEWPVHRELNRMKQSSGSRLGDEAGR